MRRKLLALAAVLGAALVAGQALPVHRAPLPVSGELQAPPAVARILRAACDDCHSGRTRWPWYAAVAPVSWWVRGDVHRGRQRLDFSNWAAYAADPGTRIQKLRNLERVLRSGSMPPWTYRLVHPAARLGPAQRDVLLRWAEEAIAAPAP